MKAYWGAFTMVLNVLMFSGAGSLFAGTSSLSEARNCLSGASAGGQIFFAGGATGPGGWHPPSSYSDAVDIYDANGFLLSTKQLPGGARMEMGAASAGGQVLFAGGHGNAVSDAVDIYHYDTATGDWVPTQKRLSEARAEPAAVSLGSKVFFAGGYLYGTLGGRSNTVDIYDTDLGDWLPYHPELSQKRASIAGASAGGKVFFAGGHFVSAALRMEASPVVDIYDTLTGDWSTHYLLPGRERWAMGAASAGGKVFFAGGFGYMDGHASAFDLVDIYDTLTGEWSTDYLPGGARASMAAASVGDQVWFAGGTYYDERNGYVASNTVDIYDTCTLRWYTKTLSEARMSLVGASVGQTIFFGGGSHTDGTYSDRVDIFTVTEGGAPIPEPVTMVSFFVGIAGIVRYLRIRLRHQQLTES
jgi:N-acetylneuraminic acid mutarotase